jgi:hypothetical protein
MKKALIVLFSLFAVLLSTFAGGYGYGGGNNGRRSQGSGTYQNYSNPSYSPRSGTYDNSRPNPYPYTQQNNGSYGQTYYTGPRGGEYYINQNGNRTYYNNPPAGTTVHEGPRGGQYYYNNSGNKTYIRQR